MATYIADRFTCEYTHAVTWRCKCSTPRTDRPRGTFCEYCGSTFRRIETKLRRWQA